MTWNIAKIVALGIGVLLLGSLVRNLFRPTAADAVTEDSRAILKATQPFKQAMARRLQAESGYVRQAARYQHDAALGAAQLRSLATQLERAATAHDTIRALDSMVVVGRWTLFKTEARCNDLDSAVTNCQERAELWRIRADTLAAALGRQVVVGSCKWLVFPCPSRAQALEFGLVLGAVTGYLLHRP